MKFRHIVSKGWKLKVRKFQVLSLSGKKVIEKNPTGRGKFTLPPCTIGLKVHLCRYKNLPISLSSHKDNMPKVSHYNTVYFLRYTHTRFMKYLFTNIQIQQNMLKRSLLFKRNSNFTGK